MIRFASVLTLMLSSVAIGQTPPDDSGKYHLVVVTAPVPTPAGAALLQSIESNPTLSRIASACKKFHFIATDPVYRQRYGDTIPPTNLPIVALVRSDGGVIFKSSGVNVMTGKPLADKLTELAIADRRANPRTIAPAMPPPLNALEDCPDGNCPNQPYQPLVQPRRPFDGSRLPSPIPDTININPSGSLNVGVPESAGYAIAAVVVFLIVMLLGFVAVAGLIAFVIYAFTRN